MKLESLTTSKDLGSDSQLERDPLSSKNFFVSLRLESPLTIAALHMLLKGIFGIRDVPSGNLREVFVVVLSEDVAKSRHECEIDAFRLQLAMFDILGA